MFLEDLNGDGKPDMVISNADGTISILLNNGKGTFGTANVITSVAALSPHLNALAIADFNGDGKLDIAAASYYPGNYSGNVYILLGNGDGTFQAPITVTAAPPTATPIRSPPATSTRTAIRICWSPSKGVLAAQVSYGSAAYIVLEGKGDGTFTPGLAYLHRRRLSRNIRWSPTSTAMASWTRSSPCWRTVARTHTVRYCSKAMGTARLPASASRSISG